MKRISMSIGLAVAALGLVAGAAERADASLIFTNYTGESHFIGFNNFTIGTQFIVGPQDLVLSRLGVYDRLGDGLNFSHLVGVWRVSDQALIASVTVPSGTSATLVEDWRFVNLATPATLVANTIYRIAALESSPGDLNPFGGTFTAGPGIASAAPGSVIHNGGFAFPETANALVRVFANGDVTPAVAAVPEPSTLISGVLGSLVVLGTRLRRRKATATA